jgi:hypothetical protein
LQTSTHLVMPQQCACAGRLHQRPPHGPTHLQGGRHTGQHRKLLSSLLLHFLAHHSPTRKHHDEARAVHRTFQNLPGYSPTPPPSTAIGCAACYLSYPTPIFLGVFVTREHNKSGIAHRGRTGIKSLKRTPNRVEPLLQRWACYPAQQNQRTTGVPLQCGVRSTV